MSKRQPMQPLSPGDLDPDAFANLAVPQPDPVKAATTPKDPPPAVAPVPSPPRKGRRGTSAATPPSRLGKVQIVAWTSEDTRAKLKAFAAMKRRSVDDLLNTAILDLLKKG